MIGQNVVFERVRGQIARNKFPHFSIFIGERGSGKKTMVKEIASLMNTPIVDVEVTADIIRDVIEDSYTVIDPHIFLLADCDNMSSTAANTLLKVTEEPPQNAYFILTCESIDNLLPTIKSRGVTYMLEPYSYEEKCDYLAIQPEQPECENFMLSIASNIGELHDLMAMDINAFKDYVNLVIDNIAEVSDSNSFKIGDKIALKDDSDKFDLRLFLKAFSSLCVDRMMTADDPLKYANAVAITGDSLQQLSVRGINKQMLFDTWVIAIREEWL